MENVWAELILFSIEKKRMLSDVIFILCTLIDNSYEPISVRYFWQLFCKIRINLEITNDHTYACHAVNNRIFINTHHSQFELFLTHTESIPPTPILHSIRLRLHPKNSNPVT